MKPKVVLYYPVPSSLLDRLQSVFEVTYLPVVSETNRAEFVSAALEADGLIGMGLPIPTDELKGAARLKVMCTVSAGYDQFDVAQLTARGIVLMNLSDPLAGTTADLAFGLLMSVARRITELDRKVRAGEWGHSAALPWFGLDIHGKTLGVIGLGGIGSEIARRGALGFGMPVLYTARTPKPEAEKQFGARRCELDELLRESDFVCIAVPLSAETTKMIGTRELSLMKPTSVLVNIARGPVIDEAALTAALRNGTIYGAGLDVFEQEPLALDSPLMNLENVVLAPHIGSATVETRDAMAAYAAESLIGYLCNGETRNVVNPQALLSTTH